MDPWRHLLFHTSNSSHRAVSPYREHHALAAVRPARFAIWQCDMSPSKHSHVHPLPRTINPPSSSINYVASNHVRYCTSFQTLIGYSPTVDSRWSSRWSTGSSALTLTKLKQHTVSSQPSIRLREGREVHLGIHASAKGFLTFLFRFLPRQATSIAFGRQ